MSTLLRIATALSVWLSLTAGNLVLAAGDSSTGAVAEIELSGGQFGMLLGGAAALGVAIWLVVRLLNR